VCSQCTVEGGSSAVTFTFSVISAKHVLHLILAEVTASEGCSGFTKTFIAMYETLGKKHINLQQRTGKAKRSKYCRVTTKTKLGNVHWYYTG